MPMKDYSDEEETLMTLQKVIDGLKQGDPLTLRKDATLPPDPEPDSTPDPKPSSGPRI